jgi:hypothetical protein
MERGRVPPRWVVAMAPLVLLLAACSASSGAPQSDDAARADGAGAVEEPASAGAGEESRGLEGDDGQQLAAPIEQRIIKTGEIGIEVDGVPDAVARLRGLALELGGYVGGSQAGTRDEAATLTLRIPAARFDEALARLHDLGEVVSEATREDDVTGQIVDLEARIANLRASEASYRELVARAERIEDVLAVQARLDQVRGEIEQLAAQAAQLAERADLATLTVVLIPRAEPVEAQAAAWDPGAELSQATAAVVGIGQGLASAAIWFVVVWIPVLLVLAVVVLLARRGVLEVRRRLPAPTLARTEGPPSA